MPVMHKKLQFYVADGYLVDLQFKVRQHVHGYDGLGQLQVWSMPMGYHERHRRLEKQLDECMQLEMRWLFWLLELCRWSFGLHELRLVEQGQLCCVQWFGFDGTQPWGCSWQLNQHGELLGFQQWLFVLVDKRQA